MTESNDKITLTADCFKIHVIKKGPFEGKAELTISNHGKILDEKTSLEFKQHILECQEYREYFEHYMTKQFLEEEFNTVSITKKQFNELIENTEKFDLIKDESLILNPNLLEESRQLKKDIENRKKTTNLLQHDNSELKEKLSDVETDLLKHQVSLGCCKTKLEKITNQHDTLKEKLNKILDGADFIITKRQLKIILSGGKNEKMLR